MKTLCLFVLLMSTACTTVGINVPTGRLESPESNRSWRPRLSGGASTQQTVIYTSDASMRPLIIGELDRANTVEYPVFKAALGLPMGFELSGRSGIIYGTSFLTAKLQLLGARAGEGKAGDFALAVTGAVGGANYKINGDQKGHLGPGGFNWSATQTSHARDGALILGYRPTDRIILYGGPFYTDWEFSGIIKHERSDDNTSPEATYELYGRGFRKGISFAFEWSTLGNIRWYFVPEIIVSQLSWTGKEESTHFDTAFATGVIF